MSWDWYQSTWWFYFRHAVVFSPQHWSYKYKFRDFVDLRYYILTHLNLYCSLLYYYLTMSAWLIYLLINIVHRGVLYALMFCYYLTQT